MNNQARYKLARRITLLGAVMNIILAGAKIIAGIFGHSYALIADGIHSLSDLLSDLLVIMASKFGSQGPDLDHHYGHSRIETAATLILALFLIVVGIGIAYDALSFFTSPPTQPLESYVIWIVIASIIIKEVLYQYTKQVADRIQSSLLHANAWHHRSDAGSSLAVLVGILGVLLGFVYMDALAAIVVGLLIVKMGWGIGWSSVRELVDTAVDSVTLRKIESIIKAVSGVLSIHQLRTRSMGKHIIVDVHIQVNSHLSVSEGHFIAQQVDYQLKQQMSNISDVTIHVDSEDDQESLLNISLPERELVLAQIKKHCQGLPGVNHLQILNFHYLSGNIEVDIAIPLEMIDNPIDKKQLIKQYKQAVSAEPISFRMILFYV